jgi:hypothetical protein
MSGSCRRSWPSSHSRSNAYSRLAFAVEQLIELAHPIRVEADNRAVDNSVLSRQRRESLFQSAEAKVPIFSGDNPALTVLQVDHSAEAVVLQLEDVFRIVERLLHHSEPHWTNATTQFHLTPPAKSLAA